MRVDQAADLGSVLRRARKNHGLTQAEAADRIGASRAWVNRVEAGRAPRAELSLLLRYLRAVDLSLFAEPSPRTIDVSGILSTHTEAQP